MSNLPIIHQGSTGQPVRWAQYLLVGLWVTYEQIDGIFGPVTQNAVQEFQGAHELTVDGIIGPATWAALDGEGPQPPTLSDGSHGPVVGTLQKRLNEGRGSFAPMSNPILIEDNFYGPMTASAVKGAQELAGIPSDGIVGLQTWALPLHAAGMVLADVCGVPAPAGR